MTTKRSSPHIRSVIPSRTPAIGNAVAILLSLFLILVKYRLRFWIGEPTPFLLFFFAVTFSAWFGGTGPGLVALIVTAIGGLVFLDFNDPRSLVQLILFVMEGAVICLMSAALRSAKLRLSAEAGETKVHLDDMEERYRLLVTRVKEYAIFMLDPEGYISTWNAGAERFKGYRAEEIIGKHFSVFYPMEDLRSKKPEHELKVAASEGSFEDEGWRIRKDGSRFWANVVITRILNNEGRLIGFSKVTRDLTERRQTEQRYALLIEGVKDYAIFMLDPEGKITTWNAGAKRIKGYSAAEVVGKHFSLFYPPEDIARGIPEYELQMAGAEGKFQDEGWRLRKDGFRFWADVTITRITDDEGALVGYAKITRDLTERRRAEQEIRTLNTDLERRVVERTAQLQQLISELRIKTEEAEEAGRIKSQFVSNVSHELRTPLNAIIGYGYLLMDGLQGRLKGEEIPRLEGILKNADDLLHLINGVLDLAKIESGKAGLNLQPIDLRTLVEEVLATIRPLLLGKPVEIETDFDQSLSKIVSDSFKIKQVLMNLMSNAAKFTKKGTISVKIRNSPGGDGIEVAIRDTGVGMTPDQLPQIYDPFYQGDGTSTREFGGTGLGLAIVKDLVGVLQGRIAVESEHHKGATFTLFLPSRIPTAEERESRSA